MKGGKLRKWKPCNAKTSTGQSTSIEIDTSIPN